MKYKILFFLSIVSILSCKKDKIDIFQEVYEVEFIGEWNAISHPTNFPTGAHFSPMFGFSHITSLDAIGLGLSATEGIKNMAETGSTAALEDEFLDYQSLNIALDKIVGSSFNTPGSNKMQLGVERGKHQVSIFSMIAPSPDWFVAVSTSLIDPNDGLWYDRVEVQAIAYDAGTDSGTDFTSADVATNPQEAIKILDYGPLTEGTDSVKNIGKFIFTRIK